MKLALVTGASSGVGAATARLFAQNGMTVVMVARREDVLGKLADEIGSKAVPVFCDASDPDAVAKMAEQVIAAHGIPDVIVHSAGAGDWKPLQETEASEALTMIGAPYLASLFVTRAFLPGMLERDSGVLIHINSPAAYVAWPSSVGYTASRAALRGFHEALSQDLVKTGVESCHVVFGKINSPYFETNSVPDEAMPLLSRTMPTLSSEACATYILNVANRPRNLAVAPFMLRFYIVFSRVFPSLTRWLVRF